ncbi:hypothetical protein PUN28_020233 [Cardiocondyla obscurior]|uniref:Uncharacterized protein n=1 Tax=Cardiocondyla obscurior TaxID=286306 RepID=A0AAW2E9N4_9HYME
MSFCAAITACVHRPATFSQIGRSRSQRDMHHDEDDDNGGGDDDNDDDDEHSQGRYAHFYFNDSRHFCLLNFCEIPITPKPPLINNIFRYFCEVKAAASSALSSLKELSISREKIIEGIDIIRDK